MTTLEQFRQADKRVTEIENNGGVYLGEGYSGIKTTKEYDEALEVAQELYRRLESQGINPFNS